jgi:hypothetical protein
LETQGKALIEELEKYKRQDGDARPVDYGDFNPEWFHQARRRFNVNDSGDIYFEVYDYANTCMREAVKYQETTRMQSRGYQKKIVTERISNHHDYNTVKNILEKHFKIV